jgi:hypothetical protein
MMNTNLINWLLDSDEPWTIFRTLKDLLNAPETDSRLISAREAILKHPQVQALIDGANSWGESPIKRHNDAAHPIYKFSTLADFGLKIGEDVQLDTAIDKVRENQSSDGAFQSVVNIPKAFGGNNQDQWTWIMCDTPILLYSLISFGLEDDSGVKRGIEHLNNLVDENGWRCVCDPELGKFRGPGRKNDFCPIANVFALKALSITQGNASKPAIERGTEALLHHWEHQKERKIYMFGIGTDFRKLKYPFVWYNILHVIEVLSRFPIVHNDPRFLEMVATVTDQSDETGRYTANSMYMSWKGWSFANKKEPSPWLTLLVHRILQRIGYFYKNG